MASALITVASMPMWSPGTRSMPPAAKPAPPPRMRRKKRGACPGREVHPRALFQVAERVWGEVVLADIVYLGRPHHPGRAAELLQCVLHGQRVDHRGQHAHVVAGDPVHAAGGQARATEDVAAADHQRSEEHTSELPSLMRISSAVFCLTTTTNNKQPITR